MKRTIIILSISITLILVGILYGNINMTTKEETVSLEETYAAQFPGQMSDLVVAPMPAFCLY